MRSAPSTAELEYPLEPPWLTYRLGRGATAVVTALFTDWRVDGRAVVPRTGPLIVVANHFSFVDPPVLAASFPRPISYLGKVELWGSPVARAFSRAIGIIPLRRGQPDRPALRAALTVLERGGVVGVFPEGTRGRERPRVLKPGLAGTALLARLSNAPLIPVGIAGTDVVDGPADLLPAALRRPAFRIRIGSPFELPPRSPRDLEADTAVVMEAIAALLPERYRRSGPAAAPA